MFTSGAARTIHKEPYVDTTFPLFYDAVEMLIPFPKIGQTSNALVAIFSADVIGYLRVFHKVSNQFHHFFCRFGF
jgi:hypothetical protein